MTRKRQFQGKKVIIMGLGRHERGSGMSAARFFVDAGAQVLVTDAKTRQDLAQSVRSLEEHRARRGAPAIRYVLGRHRLGDFDRADLVMRNPGVRLSSPYLQRALSRGIPVHTDISLFLSLSPNPVAGITGTRGKSTTAALAHEIIRRKYAGARLGGNITVSPLSFMHRLGPEDPVVLELSSWMTESLAAIGRSPHVALITNVLPDHLDAYEGMAEYAAAKEVMFHFQSRDDIAIYGYDNPRTRRMGQGPAGKARRSWFSAVQPVQGVFVRGGWFWEKRPRTAARKLAPVADLSVPGEHNVANAAAAIAAARAMGAAAEHVRAGLRDFGGMPYRLETVRTHAGVRWVNDTTSTTPEAAMAGIRAFDEPIVLICGGSEKHVAYQDLARLIAKRVKHVVLLRDAASARIERLVRQASDTVGIEWAGSMKSAVARARAAATAGDVVLLSPAAASFGLFTNEFDRGDRFNQAVRALKK